MGVSTERGYLRFPAIRDQVVVFVCEDDIWTAPADGGLARRLTANLGAVWRPVLSPDSSMIAFTGTDETHPEVYVMPAGGGPERRVTHLGATSMVVGWTTDGRILFSSDTAVPFPQRANYLYAVSPEGGDPERLPFGIAQDVSFGPGSKAVIGRSTLDPATWKRYRGGRKGDIWVDPTGRGSFRRLVDLDGNLACPMWVGDRIYFISDHEGVGNLYSCRPDGRDLMRHTDHGDYYARFAKTDGSRIVYQCSADAWLFDPTTDVSRRVDVELRSPRVQRKRKFVDADRFLFDFNLHPEGHSVAVETRGRVYAMPLWEQAVRQYGLPDGVRYRLGHWLHDGKRIVVISDEGGEEAIELHPSTGGKRIRRFDRLDLGRVTEMVASPTAAQVAVANHRNELFVVDIGAARATLVDRTPYGPIAGPVWSADGKWIAYSVATSPETRAIKLVRPSDGEGRLITRPDFRDFAPSFDPEGKYLYFLSYRVLDPVYDALFFDLGFPRSIRPYLVTLRAEDPSPFLPEPKGLGDKPKEETEEKKPARGKRVTPEVRIDLDGIEDRVVAFPIPEGRYTQVWGVKEKVLFTAYPVEGSLSRDWFAEDEVPKGRLEIYDFSEQRHDTLVQGVGSFKVAGDGATVAYRSGRRIRAIKAGAKPDEKSEREPPGRKSGWIDLGRVKVSVDPGSEWRQMYREAWRLMRENFWVPDMSRVDWKRVYDRYLPLVDRVASRLEFSDLMWEMQGELGTSHAYEMLGDYRRPPSYAMGFLGADLSFDRRAGVWRISHIVKGDSWDPDRDSPLRTVGARLKEGDSILAVGGQPVSETVSPQSLLVNRAGQAVELTVGDGQGRRPRAVVVKALREESQARYREWVESNRALVHEATGGRVGYVHIPDMGPPGYSEFHRYYLSEVDREALIVDVRFNRGGHVSSLLLEKLARKRIGYTVSRWWPPRPYPQDSVAGPIVCITNEYAGSDGDIFTHCFKLMKIGPVVGKRTWGGVIGISPRHRLVDGSITTQPEFSFWFVDVAWGVENYGTDPDYEVDIRPQDYVAGKDPQMEKAVSLVTQALARHRPVMPNMRQRPNLALPRLPARKAVKKGKAKAARRPRKR